MTTAYLAARYARHPEMREYAAQLAKIGITVPADWITGDQSQDEMAFQEHAWRAIEDCLGADYFITFTEDPQSPIGGQTCGGRHVEFGVALLDGRRTIVVGFRENIFHYLPDVEFFETWDECLAVLTAERTGVGI